jgi:hypothetical protein
MYNADITIKDFDEGKETLQAKRRRMLQFCPENVEVCAVDGFLKSPVLKMKLPVDFELCPVNDYMHYNGAKFHQYLSLYMQMECPMTDGLLESLQVDLDFSSRSFITSASVNLSWFFSIYPNTRGDFR